MFRHGTIYLTLLAFFMSSCCCKISKEIAPVIEAPPHPKEIEREKRISCHLPQDFSISPFTPLTEKEKNSFWGQEYTIALTFAKDFDLYRAITGFKRALFLLPEKADQRKLEIEYSITLAYFLGHKYGEVIYTVESTDLACVDSSFPAFSDLLLVLYDSYQHVGKCAHAEHILSLIEQENPGQALKLHLLGALRRADFEMLYPDFQNIVCGYYKEAKSIRKAQALNATLPGAGYWYVGMKNTAVTACAINALFIAAATHFICNGNGAAAIITLSLEGGWYFGGINGAGFAAKQYNEQLYCKYADKIVQREHPFPSMMLNFTF